MVEPAPSVAPGDAPPATPASTPEAFWDTQVAAREHQAAALSEDVRAFLATAFTVETSTPEARRAALHAFLRARGWGDVDTALGTLAPSRGPQPDALTAGAEALLGSSEQWVFARSAVPGTRPAGAVVLGFHDALLDLQRAQREGLPGLGLAYLKRAAVRLNDAAAHLQQLCASEPAAARMLGELGVLCAQVAQRIEVLRVNG